MENKPASILYKFVQILWLLAVHHQAFQTVVVFNKYVKITFPWSELPNLALFPSQFSSPFALGIEN